LDDSDDDDDDDVEGEVAAVLGGELGVAVAVCGSRAGSRTATPTVAANGGFDGGLEVTAADEVGIPVIPPFNTHQLTEVPYAPPLTQEQWQLMLSPELMLTVPQQGGEYSADAAIGWTAAVRGTRCCRAFSPASAASGAACYSAIS